MNDQFLNWDPENRLKVQIVSTRAYHSPFTHNMCIRPVPEELENFGTPDLIIYNVGQFPCNRYTHYMTSFASVDLNLAGREMVILGTQYAGEVKMDLFSVMCYLMPKRQILSLHSGCNVDKDGDVALLFELSGTGKITLFTDHNRYLSEMMNTVRVTMTCQTLRMMGFILIISAPYLLRLLALLW